jgi:hypothetical protein
MSSSARMDGLWPDYIPKKNNKGSRQKNGGMKEMTGRGFAPSDK